MLIRAYLAHTDLPVLSFYFLHYIKDQIVMSCFTIAGIPFAKPTKKQTRLIENTSIIWGLA